jgi:DNA-binding beta-propeller fold protein YncE
VTARGSDSVLEFDAAELVTRPASALTHEVRVGEAPVGLALVHHQGTLVVSDSDRFAVAGHGPNLAVVQVAPGGSLSLSGYVLSGSFPRDMATSPDGSTLVVSNYGSGQVEAVDTARLPQ